MKKVILTAVGLVLGMFLTVPLFVEGPAGGETAVLPAVPTPAAGSETESEKQGTDESVLMRVKTENGVEEMTMEDYLWSVTAAEMPAAFQPEALKAQAVSARTYAVWKMEHGEDNHPDAHVCTDIGCCQAFITKADAQRSWGASAGAYTAKIADAVADTDGMIMTYQGETVQAVFFSSAAGRTEDAVAVWGSAVPYLVGVESPEGENVPNYETQVTLTAAQFREIFLAKYPGANLSGKPEGWFGKTDLTASGRVASMEVGGLAVEGTVLRSLFSLRSACFQVETDGDKVTFTVTGYGHGVGMSQYGANAMAKAGSSWEEILLHYYTGVSLEEST